MKTKDRVEKFIEELNDLFRRHELVINCHADFVSVLKDMNTNKHICCLYEDCEPDLDEVEDAE